MKEAPGWGRLSLLRGIVAVILQELAVSRQEVDSHEFDDGVPLSPSPEPSVMTL